MSAGSPSKKEKRITYLSLLRDHSEFRIYITSYVVTMIGEWLTYVASMSMIEEASGGTASKLAISWLVVVRLLPTVLFSPLGGVMADSFDRKINMIALDITATFVSLLFLVAYFYKSLLLVYVATFAQQSLAGLYEPSRSAIVPMLVPKDSLPKATTAVGMVWSTMTALGASLSGIIVSSLGVSQCFLIDALTYAASALILGLMKKNYSVADESDDLKDSERASSTTEFSSRQHTSSSFRMIMESVLYLFTSAYGPLVLVKGCGSILFGASDVLAVEFSERDGKLDSFRLGIFFAFVGIGCVAGPNSFDHFWTAHGKGDQRAWLIGEGVAYGLVAVGFAMLGFSGHFAAKCFWNAVRASGVAVLWIDSSQLLQVTTPKRLLGRIMAIDLALATLGETVSAVGTGVLLDETRATADTLAILLGSIAGAFCLVWTLYGFFMSRKYNENNDAEREVEMMDPLSQGIGNA